MHAFDRILFWRTVVMASLAGAMALAVVVTTDEGHSTWAMRGARMAAFAPALAGLAVAVTLGQAHGRGEIRALGALGVSPWRAGLGAMAAAWLVGAVGVALVLSPATDVSALFPRVVASAPWQWDGVGLVDPLRGVRVLAEGAVQLGPSGLGRGGIEPGGRLAAVAAVAPLAVSVPAWVSAPIRPWPRAAAVALTLAATVGVLHAVGAGRAAPAWLLAVALPIGLQALQGHLRG